MNRKFFFGWLASLAVLAGLAFWGWHWLDTGLDLCEDVVMQKAVSPDSHLTAIVYSRSCGVFTTGFTTQVALVKNGEDVPREPGNVYVERSENSQPQVSVQWEGSRNLLVKDAPQVAGRIATWAEKQVPVNLGWRGWFRSADITVRYAELPMPQKAKKK